MSGNNIETYKQDSSSSSLDPLSSPARVLLDHNSSGNRLNLSNSSIDFEDESIQSSPRTSPPSSPVRRGQKRSSYAAYKENPSLPVPRQTIDRWKRLRLAADDNAGVHSTSANHAASASELPADDNVGVGDFEAGRDSFNSCSLEISDSGEELDSSSESGDSSAGQNNLSFSDASLASDNNSEFHSEVSDESELDSNCDENIDPFEVNSLYPGSEKTKDEAIFQLISLYLRNKLTRAALRDMLKLYVTSLPATHVMPRTVYHLLQYVSNLSLPLNETEHYYCRPAMHPVVSKLDPCATCGSVDIGVFYELNLEKILKFLFEQRGLADLLDKYSEERTACDNISDIVDGSEYKRVWSGVSNKYKLTLILNTDGVSPHSSSKAKFWPLMFTIMEVPPHLRSSFTIVWGIWFDKKYKPNMNLYLKPFVRSLVKIHEDGGVSWKSSLTRSTHVSPVRAPLMVADAPARAGVLNMQEHQSKNACNACEQKTSKLPPPPTVPGEKKKKRKRRFIFKEEAATLRTYHRMLLCGEVGTASKPKKGIKGSTVIQDIPYLDLSTCVVAEYMHCVLSGVVRQICSLWLFEKGPWSIANNLNEINKFLDQEIHPSDLVTRLPRSFEYFSQLKCNELRSFLLYYSLVIVAPFLKDEYHQHWMLFVQAIFLLLTESISENDLMVAETLLRIFVRDISKLYGDENYVYNVHQLLHLVLYVRRWGPLWSNSAFGFEDVNGTLSSMIHGSKNEGRELLNQLALAQGNQMLKNKIASDTFSSRGVSVLGKALPRNLTDVEMDRLQELNSEMEGFKCYGRVLVGRELFSSEVYDKQFRRRNSYVEVSDNGRKVYGRIVFFCKCSDCVFCFLSVYKVVHRNFFFHRASLTRVVHIIPVEDSGEVIVCRVSDIVQKLIQVGNYLCFPPNTVERNL